MFTPDAIDKRFIVSDVTIPSEKVTAVVNEIYNHLLELNKNAEFVNAEVIKNKVKGQKVVKVAEKPIDLTDVELVKSICVKMDYYKTKPAQAYNEIMKHGAEYFDFLKTTTGRVVVSSEDKKMAEELRDILTTDKVCRGFFIPKKGCEVLFQVHLYGQFEVSFDNVQVLPTKGAVDILHINHNRKEIREVDLKCTDDAFKFDDITGPIKRFDYVGQHSFYDYLLREWIKTYKDGMYKDYSVMNPLNVVIDREAKVPYLYEYNQNDLYVKRHGIENTKIRGWEDILNEIAFHLDCNDWSRPMQHIKNGRMFINVFSRR